MVDTRDEILLLLLIVCSLAVIPVCASATPLSEGLAYSGDTTILARGDPITIDLGNRLATVWIFQNSGTHGLYDLKYTERVGTNYTFKLTREQSESLDTGQYTVVLQYNGANAIKEVSYKEEVGASGTTHKVISSPYKTVEDVPIDGMQPSMVLIEFENMAKYFGDDRLVKFSVDIQEPQTTITSIDQITDTMVRIEGVSNLQAGTPVYILWDEERQVSPSDIAENTFSSKIEVANVTKDTSRNVWLVNATVDFQNMPVGRHWVTVTANGQVTRVYHDIREGFGTGYIANATVKYLSDGVVVTPTPITVIETVIVPEYRTVIQTVVITTKPYPKNAIGEEYDPSVKPEVANVLFPLGIACIGILILRRIGL